MKRSILLLSVCLLTLLMGCDNSDDDKSQEVVEKKEIPYPVKNLIGRWQSECNFRHFGRPVITSIDIRAQIIRRSNHFFYDKNCIRSDTVEREDYRFAYVKDTRILADITAHLFRLAPGLTKDESDDPPIQEIFSIQGNWLYISVVESGPEFDKPWDLDSNFGLRRLR